MLALPHTVSRWSVRVCQRRANEPLLVSQLGNLVVGGGVCAHVGARYARCGRLSFTLTTLRMSPP
jgi:hypothetical protein